MSSDDQVTYFGLTDFRNQRTKFGIKNKDRSRHVYVIGKTGMGKSTLLENMAAQDILNNEGMAFVDPHGSAIDTLIEYIPPHRVQDVVYFAPFDTNYPISFNVMEDVGADSRHLVVNGLMASFKKIWQDAWSARMEYILTNTLLALLEYPGSTLLGVNRMLAEKDYRNEVIKHITDASVKAFWIDEYGKWDPRYAREAGAAIQNKIGQFTANPLIRNIIGQPRSSFDVREIMDEQKILLINLSKGRIGEQNANLLGGMLITKIYLAAMSRAEVGSAGLKNLPNFFFFVDEFQNFANESFADILSEARKYRLNLTIAHQYVAQMPEEVKDAVVGNVGTMVTFRIGAEDAELFEKQFSPVFTAEDIVNLGRFQIYLSLMIDGIGSRPFSARTIAPIAKPNQSMVREVIQASRSQYAEERSVVEARIAQWFEPIKKPERRVLKDKKNVKSGSPSSQKSTSKPKPEQTHYIREHNEDPSIKKIQKQIDEKEAELEMKKMISPKLDQLLGQLDADSSPASTTPKQGDNNASHTQSKKQQDIKTGDRGKKGDTQSALSAALNRALAQNNTKNTSSNTHKEPKKNKKKPPIADTQLSGNTNNSNHHTSIKPQKETQKELSKTSDRMGGKKKISIQQHTMKSKPKNSKSTHKHAVSSVNTPSSSRLSKTGDADETTPVREVPEDVLRNILD